MGAEIAGVRGGSGGGERGVGVGKTRTRHSREIQRNTCFKTFSQEETMQREIYLERYVSQRLRTELKTAERNGIKGALLAGI